MANEAERPLANRGREERGHRSGGPGSRARSRSWTRVREVIFAIGFLVFWLAPIFWEGVFKQPLHAWLPDQCHDQYRITCLFPAEHRVKLEFYVQAATRNGEWFELPDAEYTPMNPFGYVNRNWVGMYGINSLAIRQTRLRQEERTPETIPRLEREQRDINERLVAGAELATWYRERYQAKHPDRAELASVRFLAVWHPVGSEIASPDGHWRRQRVEDIPEDRVHEILRRNFRGS